MLLQNEAVVPEVISYFVADFFHPSTTFISIGIYRNLAVIFKGKSFILCLVVDDLFRKINVAFYPIQQTMVENSLELSFVSLPDNEPKQ